jgi:hypothetical protein
MLTHDEIMKQAAATRETQRRMFVEHGGFTNEQFEHIRQTPRVVFGSALVRFLAWFSRTFHWTPKVFWIAVESKKRKHLAQLGIPDPHFPIKNQK